MAADYCGRVIAEQYYATSKERVMLAEVPVKSVFTIYSVTGDLFAWLCITGLIILIAVAMIRRGRT
jgi:apolipoprotein N-acyltransferase